MRDRSSLLIEARVISVSVARLRTARGIPRYLDHVRTLCHHLDAGSDPGAVRLWRAAEFPAALQCGADPADPRGAPPRRQALVRADALGPAAVLGQGPEDVSAPDQCARRIR